MTVTSEEARARLMQYLLEQVNDALDREGLSRTELARRLGVSPSYITVMLSGRRRLTLTFLASIIEELGYELVIEPRDSERP